MTDATAAVGSEGFTDAGWAVWKPRIEAVRPRGKTPPKDLRRTMAAIFWRHRNGAKWRAIPAELGPWWLAAQLFIRWAKQGVWERLLERAQEHVDGLELGLTVLDGTNILGVSRSEIVGVSQGEIAWAHTKAAGAPKKGELARAETSVKPGDFASRNADLVALGVGSGLRP